MSGVDRSLQIDQAWHDLAGSLGRWRMWGFIGLQDIKLRYRRSMLGPFWITLTMGMTVLTVGLVYSVIFKTDVKTYLPFFALGFMIWNFISTVIVESGHMLILEGQFIRQSPTPLLVYLFKSIWKNIIIFAHNFVIFLVIALYFAIPITPYSLLALVGYFFVVWNCTWMSLLLSIICARFRDIPPIVSSVMGVFFFITPILWNREGIGGGLAVLEANPFYHMVQVFRAPLLGTPLSWTSWAFVAGLALVGSLLTFLFFSRYRRRIAYWV